MPILLMVLLSCAREEGSPSLDPGRVTLHRLNRAEYDNTVRDLFGTTLRPARDFPADDFGYGFDNIAEVLSLSPLHVELYERAADALVDDLFGLGTVPEVETRIEAEGVGVTATVGGIHDATAWNLWDAGALSATVWPAQAGPHRVEVQAFGVQAGDELVRMAIEVDGQVVTEVDVAAIEGGPEVYAADVELDAGSHVVTARFLNEFEDPAEGADRNLIVDWLGIVGPVGVPREPSAGGARVLVCTPVAGDAVDEAACAEEILWAFGERAWRRPLTRAEFDDKIANYAVTRNSGGDWQEAVGNVLKSVLIAPEFVYRVELDPTPELSSPRLLTTWELATRLSYFLWSSMPDDQLRERARDGSLLELDVLEAETLRMLADPKADALIENLAGQWLFIRALDEAFPDATYYPAWDDGLRASMKDELRLFVGGVLQSDRDMLDLLTAPETYVDARLAEHYGLDLPPGATGFVKVSTEGTPRRGLLTQGGLLTALSYPTRTSPVKRGIWVLDNLFCEAPPPPPPGVEGLPDDPAAEPLTQRELLEQHRADPACASCHDIIDPIGLSMEHFDGIGRYRDVDEQGFPVDATGVLPDGRTFDGVDELTVMLAEDPKIPRCMAQKVFTYALGRPPVVEDLVHLDLVQQRFDGSGRRFAALAVAIVQSAPFRYRGPARPPLEVLVTEGGEP